MKQVTGNNNPPHTSYATSIRLSSGGCSVLDNGKVTLLSLEEIVYLPQFLTQEINTVIWATPHTILIPSALFSIASTEEHLSQAGIPNRGAPMIDTPLNGITTAWNADTTALKTLRHIAPMAAHTNALSILITQTPPDTIHINIDGNLAHIVVMNQTTLHNAISTPINTAEDILYYAHAVATPYKKYNVHLTGGYVQAESDLISRYHDIKYAVNDPNYLHSLI